MRPIRTAAGSGRLLSALSDWAALTHTQFPSVTRCFVRGCCSYVLLTRPHMGVSVYSHWHSRTCGPKGYAAFFFITQNMYLHKISLCTKYPLTQSIPLHKISSYTKYPLTQNIPLHNIWRAHCDSPGGIYEFHNWVGTDAAFAEKGPVRRLVCTGTKMCFLVC